MDEEEDERDGWFAVHGEGSPAAVVGAGSVILYVLLDEQRKFS